MCGELDIKVLRVFTLGIRARFSKRPIWGRILVAVESAVIAVEGPFWCFEACGCLSTSDVPKSAKPLRVNLLPLSPFGLEPLLTAQRTGGTSERKIP